MPFEGAQWLHVDRVGTGRNGESNRRIFVLLVASALQITWDMEHIWQGATHLSGEEFPSPHLMFMQSGGTLLYKMVSIFNPKNAVC